MSFSVSIDASQEHPIAILKDNTTHCEAEIFSFGGLLNAFSIPFNGKMQNFVEGFADVADAQQHITQGFKSTKLSPFVCRMNKGQYRYNNQLYQVTRHFMVKHAIHGLLFDAVYTFVNQEAGNDFASVTLSHEYQGTDAGYPFTYHITITWKLEAGNRLSVQTIVEHSHTAAIPLADGWHPYFTLGGKVDDWKLDFSASNLLEYDDELIPTGRKTRDTQFVNGSSLQGVTLDNGFEFIGRDDNHCTLSNKQFSLRIEPDASYPVLQVYTPPHRNSIAIENLSGAPDNFNNGMGLVLLAPGEKKAFGTSYVIQVADN